MKRRELDREPEPAPVAPAPVAEVLAVTDDQGRLMVTLDGAVITASPIGRAAFGALLDELLRRRQQPIALVLIVADGNRYSDVLHPAPATPEIPPPAADPPPVVPDPRPEPYRGGPERPAAGFIPGEAVAIATVTSHQSADTAGRVPILDQQIPAGEEVVVIGRISGTVLILPQAT